MAFRFNREYYKSPIFENEEEATKWRDEKLKKYPDSSINKYDDEKNIILIFRF